MVGLPRMEPTIRFVIHVLQFVARWLTERIGSDIVHFEVLGNRVVVVNSTKAAQELFEKRSNLYSGK